MSEIPGPVVDLGDAARRGDRYEGMNSDRRAHERLPVLRPCKAIDHDRQRYLTGVTTNVSNGGALLELRCADPFHAGQELRLGVSWHGGAVIRSETLLDASVVRCETLDADRQRVAVRYREPVAVPVAA